MPIKTAVILAAGRGNRMNPLTKIIPKPMLRVAGCPFIEYLIKRLQKIGIQRVIIVVGHLKDHITSYFKNGAKWCINVQYAIQKELLGMADALNTTKKALVNDHDFLVCAADTLITSQHLTQLIIEHQRKKSAITLCLQKTKLKNPVDTALVRLEKDHRVSFIIEKPPLDQAPSNIASIPIYIFNKNLFNHLENINKSNRGEHEIQDAIQATIEQKERVQGVFIDSRVTLSTVQDYLSVNWYFLNKLDIKTIRGTVAENTIIKPPVLICQNSLVKSDCEIGPFCYLEQDVQLEEGVSVKNTIILSGACVKKNAQLKNTVILPNAVVPAGTQIGKPGIDNVTCFPDI